jgi:Uma2 family endonuclease
MPEGLTVRTAVVIEPYHLRIPGWIVDLGSFSRWVKSDEFPSQGRIDYLQGEVWVDMGDGQARLSSSGNGSRLSLPGRSRRAKGDSMCAVVLEADNVFVPAAVTDLATFRRWADSPEFPEHGRICYLAGEVWIDMSKEQLFTHNRLKTRYYLVLGGLVDVEKLGYFFSDGVSIVHSGADLSTIPDALFLSTESLASGRARLVEGARQGFVEVEGSADMALEVVSDSSVYKDTVRLRELYWQAGVREYWLVDARKKPLTFEILRHTAKGYVAARKQGGWLKSAVFGKSFRLTQATDELGHPAFTLEVR